MGRPKKVTDAQFLRAIKRGSGYRKFGPTIEEAAALAGLQPRQAYNRAAEYTEAGLVRSLPDHPNEIMLTAKGEREL